MNLNNQSNPKKRFHWSGLTQNGMRTTGQTHAPNKKALQEMLLKKKVTLLHCTKKSDPITLFKNQKLKQKHIAAFTQQLADLLAAGIPLSEALCIIHNSAIYSGLKYVSKTLKDAIASGISFSDALKKFPQYFDAIYYGLTEAGEQSGALDAMLKQLAFYQERTLTLKTKLKKALFYPITVLLTMLAVSSALLFFVIPKFQAVFDSFGATLPAFTRLIIQIANATHSYTAGCIALCLLFSIGYCVDPRHRSALAKRSDGLLLHIPLLNKLIIDAVMTRWSHVLSTLLLAGLPITEALAAAHNTITHHALQKRMHPILSRIEAGEALHIALQSVKDFPAEYVQMIAVGENTGKLGDILGKMNQRQQIQLDHRLDHLSQWLEPAMMILLAILVGGLIIAMYLPIFQMGSVI